VFVDTLKHILVHDTSITQLLLSVGFIHFNSIPENLSARTQMNFRFSS